MAMSPTPLSSNHFFPRAKALTLDMAGRRPFAADLGAFRINSSLPTLSSQPSIHLFAHLPILYLPSILLSSTYSLVDLCIHLPIYLLTLLNTHLSIYIWPTGSSWTTQPSTALTTRPAVLTYLSSWALFIFNVSKLTLLS